MKHPVKTLSAVLLTLVLAFTSFTFTVSAEDAEILAITAGDRETMLSQYKDFFTQQMRKQENGFIVSIKEDAAGLYTISDEMLVLKSTGEADPYLATMLIYDEFKAVPANEYLVNVIDGSKKDSFAINFSCKYTDSTPAVVTEITLTFTVQWRETADQTQHVKSWASDWVSEHINGAGIVGEHNIVKAIHDYIANNFSYDEALSIFTARQMLSEGKGVCQAYSLLARAMLDAASIESRLVFVDSTATNEKGTGNHMWNMVRVDGHWYHMDVTWDDPLGGDTVRYDYFLKSDDTMRENHSWNGANLPSAPEDYPPKPDSSSSGSGGSSSSSHTSSRTGSAPVASIQKSSSAISSKDQSERSKAGYTSGTAASGIVSSGGGQARGTASGGPASLRMLWLFLGIVFLAVSGVAVFTLLRRGKA